MSKYTWNPDAKESAVNMHRKSLEAAIQYYENRKNTKEAQKLRDELESMNAFYKRIEERV